LSTDYTLHHDKALWVLDPVQVKVFSNPSKSLSFKHPFALNILHFPSPWRFFAAFLLPLGQV